MTAIKAKEHRVADFGVKRGVGLLLVVLLAALLAIAATLYIVSSIS